jgi:hypothetical protein
MSAEQSARSISDAEGVDRVRALQRVLYRSAKQDPARRFHALFNHVARSDILWRAWGFYMQRWPSKRAMASIKDKARQATDRRFVGYSLETAVQRLNPVLRGWGNYFRVGNSARKFSTVDSYVHMRLPRLASTKYGLSHRNWARTNRFNLEWLVSLEVYRLTGTVRWKTAHAVR